MSTYALNYAIWTGLVGVVLEWAKRRGGARWQTLLMKGGEKAVVGLISSYLQQMNFTLIGNGLDANYIYNGIVGALEQELTKGGSLYGSGKLAGAEEQILCALIGHRLAANWGMAFEGISSNFAFINNMFASSSGYNDASIPKGGIGVPNQASGNPPSATSTGMGGM